MMTKYHVTYTIQITDVVEAEDVKEVKSQYDLDCIEEFQIYDIDNKAEVYYKGPVKGK